MTPPKTYATLRVSSDSQDIKKNRADIGRAVARPYKPMKSASAKSTGSRKPSPGASPGRSAGSE